MSFPVRQICLFVSSYVFEWQYVWLVVLLLESEAGERQKEWWGICEHSHGSCSFFAWVAFREAGYLADDKCPCTLSCLRTPPAFKPWQPAQPQPHSLRPPTSTCPLVQQINGSLSSLWPAAAVAAAVYAKSSLSNMGGNTHVQWQVRPPWQWDVPGIITETTCVAGKQTSVVER